MSIADAASPGRIAAALERVIDPELGIDVVDLGLLYSIEVDEHDVHIELGVTTPGCPHAARLAEDALAAVLSVPTVARATVELAFVPPWSPQMLSKRAARRLRSYVDVSAGGCGATARLPSSSVATTPPRSVA